MPSNQSYTVNTLLSNGVSMKIKIDNKRTVGSHECSQKQFHIFDYSLLLINCT